VYALSGRQYPRVTRAIWATVVALGAAGAAGAISVQVLAYARIRQAEAGAAETLAAIADAQRVFQKTGGRSGFATDLESLTHPCPGDTSAALSNAPDIAAGDYRLVLRPARRAAMVGTDCHDRATADDFYAAVRPAHAWAGRHAMAVTSIGRIYVFFDGIAPLEGDMEFRGLAIPLDAVGTFRIP
jgi:hypothetical protein